MRRLCISSVWLVWMWWLPSLAAAKSALFYYGNEIAWSVAGVHDYIVVEPEHIRTYAPGFRIYRDKVYAYVSVGEIDPEKTPDKKIPKHWILGTNKTFKSIIADMTAADYRARLLERIARLRKRGFKHFFFDTLDASEAVLTSPQKITAQRRAIAAFLREVHHRFPDARFILNRGFEIVDTIKEAVDAVAFESYYAGLDAALNYVDVSEEARRWLDAKLAPVREAKIDIIAIDYLPDLVQPKAKTIARKLQARGFIPYVSTKYLDAYGISAREAIRRDILVLYDDVRREGLTFTTAHRFAAMPLEHLGYVPVLRDIKRFDFRKDLPRRYAGIVIWIEGDMPHPDQTYAWVRRQAKRGVYTLVLGRFGVQNKPEALRRLGVRLRHAPLKRGTKCRITHRPDFGDFETPWYPQPDGAFYRPNDAEILYAYRCGTHMSVVAALTPWGGYALGNSVTAEFDDDTLWVLDPFVLFRKALRLHLVPVPDPTTESGRRLLFTHIDGDGVMNRAEFDPDRFSGEVIYEEVLRRYPIPHSVSFVGAEIMPNGLYPNDSPRLLALARKIYALPYVETATHTFSHPFVWGRITPQGDLDKRYRLDVPGYDFNLSYELEGTLAFFDTNLSRPLTRKPKAVFWSGDCMPPASVLAHTYQAGLRNINGGDTTITDDRPWLYLVAPYGIEKGGYYQVYTGQQNENVYTNEFHGPFWGYMKVIQTFVRTETPRRLKPVDIYYHFYSGSKTASLKALRKAFDWALEQPLMPIYTSEYIPKVWGFYHASVAKDAQGCYLLNGFDALRTVRIDGEAIDLDLNRSRGIVGYKRETGRTYVSLSASSDSATLCLARTSSLHPTPYLIEANGKVEGNATHARIVSYVPVEARWHLPEGCKLRSVPDTNVTYEGEATVRIVSSRKEVAVDVACR